MPQRPATSKSVSVTPSAADGVTSRRRSQLSRESALPPTALAAPLAACAQPSSAEDSFAPRLSGRSAAALAQQQQPASRSSQAPASYVRRGLRRADHRLATARLALKFRPTLEAAGGVPSGRHCRAPGCAQRGEPARLTAAWPSRRWPDILSFDDLSARLPIGAFEEARRGEVYGLPAALRAVTLQPARATGLTGRG